MQIGNKILVVCLGNICRSPAAEGFIAAHFKKKSVSVEIASAGIEAVVGSPAAENAQKVMQEIYNIDISAHRAQQLTEQMMRDYSLILVMDDAQALRLKKIAPFASGKTHKMGKWRNVNIADPYRQPEAAFQSCCALLHDCVNDWIEKLY